MSSPEQAAQNMINNLKEKTGRDLSAWINIVNKSGLEKHGEIVKLLKSEYGITHGYANLVAHKAKHSDAGSSVDDDLISAQYSGPKYILQPIYDSLIKEISKFGKDVELAPKKAYVSIRRKKQFAIIQPSTKTRVDVGINLKGTKPAGRLEASGSFNTMVSHRVKLDNKSQVNKELIGWLKSAYEAA